MHTHTTYSDGIKLPHEIIDGYHKKGYSILSLTDHATYDPGIFVTYPWDEFTEHDFWKLSLENSVLYNINGFAPQFLAPVLANLAVFIGNLIGFTALVALIYFIIAFASYCVVNQLKGLLDRSHLIWQGFKILVIGVLAFYIIEVIFTAPLSNLIMAHANSLKFLAVSFGALFGIVLVRRRWDKSA